MLEATALSAEPSRRRIGFYKKGHCSISSAHLVPNRIEASFDGLRLLLVGVARFRAQLDLDVGVAQPVRVHRDQVPGLNN